MTVDEFKNIYFWEWGHRMLGRTVGVVFGLPLLYFVARGRVRGPLAKRLGLLFLLGGAQVCHSFYSYLEFFIFKLFHFFIFLF